jgi:hypothetical protein
MKPLAVTDGRLENVVGFSGYRKNGEHSDCCAQQPKYPRDFSAGFGVSDYAHGKLSLFDITHRTHLVRQLRYLQSRLAQ